MKNCSRGKSIILFRAGEKPYSAVVAMKIRTIHLMLRRRERSMGKSSKVFFVELDVIGDAFCLVVFRLGAPVAVVHEAAGGEGQADLDVCEVEVGVKEGCCR
jgi:hypothetical protein